MHGKNSKNTQDGPHALTGLLSLLTETADHIFVLGPCSTADVREGTGLMAVGVVTE